MTVSRSGGGFRRGLVPRKQIELPLKWIRAYWGQSPPPLRRTLGAPQGHCRLEIVTDASPWGLGGYLEDIATGTILQFFASPLGELDTQRFQVQIGDAAGQQYWESLSILVSLHLWGRHFSHGKAKFQVRGDSVVALTLATKLASTSPRLNALGAEISLQLEMLEIEEVYGQHTPGRLLVLADWLSRVHEPSGNALSPPPQLASAKRRQSPVRDDGFFRVWSIAA